MTAQAEPLHDIAHLGSVELLTPKLDKSLWYFRDLLGMEAVHQSGPSIYLRGYGDYATSTLKLTEAAQPGGGCVSWRTDSPQALERRAKVIGDAGLGIGWTNGDFGRGRSYRFHDPDECSPNIVQLRELHAAMDRAALDAYGWVDIPTRCEFVAEFEDDEDEEESGRARRKKYRYRWPDVIRDEVLARLLELNRQRAFEEGQLPTEAPVFAGMSDPESKTKGSKEKAGKRASEDLNLSLLPQEKEEA